MTEFLTNEKRNQMNDCQKSQEHIVWDKNDNAVKQWLKQKRFTPTGELYPASSLFIDMGATETGYKLFDDKHFLSHCERFKVDPSDIAPMVAMLIKEVVEKDGMMPYVIQYLTEQDAYKKARIK